MDAAQEHTHPDATPHCMTMLKNIRRLYVEQLNGFVQYSYDAPVNKRSGTKFD